MFPNKLLFLVYSFLHSLFTTTVGYTLFIKLYVERWGRKAFVEKSSSQISSGLRLKAHERLRERFYDSKIELSWPEW